MKAILTPAILNFLIKQGYRYCLSKTQSINKDLTEITIILTPVIQKPRLDKLPEDFDTYFHIKKEPRQMALGIDETEILINLNEKDALSMQTFLYGTESNKSN